MTNFNISQSQRYFHFVVLKGKGKAISSGFLKTWNITQVQKHSLPNGCTFRHMTIESRNQYYRGEVDFSVNGDNSAPFIFDIIWLDFEKNGMTVLGFPFKRLAEDLVSSLISDYSLLKLNNFIKPNLNNLLKENQEQTEITFEKNNFQFVGLSLNIARSDSLVSTIKLEGDAPTGSEIYKDNFKQDVELGKYGLEKCSLKITIDKDYAPDFGKVITRIHLDKFGNFKLYLHNRGRNVISFPAMFAFLGKFDYFTETPNSPISHISED